MELKSILVVLDHPQATPLLQASVELAHKSGAEIKVMYLENIEWYEISSLSVSTQVSGFRGEVLPLTEQDIKEQSQALAARFKKMVTAFSQSHKIKYNYHSVRGSSDDELLKGAAADADLVMVRRSGSFTATGYHLDKTSRNLAVRSAAPALIWNDGSQWPNTIIGLCTDPDESREIIRWATGLGKIMNKSIRLFWPTAIAVSEDWMSTVIPGTDKDSAVSLLRSISEIHPVDSPADLQHFQNALLILRRDDLGRQPVLFLNDIQNSVLLI